LTTFDKLFEKLTNDMESRLSKQLDFITYDQASEILQELDIVYGKSVKDFVYSIVLQSKNNVSEVIFLQ
jgi:hypothetical protein